MGKPRGSATMEVIVDLARHRLGDTWHLGKIAEPGLRNRSGRAEMQQQRLLALGADPRHLVEDRFGDLLRALGAMRADHEAVRLIAQTLQEVKHRALRLQAER